MRPRGRDDTGAGSIEHALLLAAIAVVALPILFVLGQIVRETFGSTCEGIAQQQDTTCTAVAGVKEGPAPPADDPEDPTDGAEAGVNSWAAEKYGDRGEPETDCDEVTERPAPEKTTTSCTVRFPNGDSEKVEVTWVAGSGHRTVRET